MLSNQTCYWGVGPPSSTNKARGVESEGERLPPVGATGLSCSVWTYCRTGSSGSITIKRNRRSVMYEMKTQPRAY